MVYFAIIEGRCHVQPWTTILFFVMCIAPILLCGLGGPYMVAYAVRHCLAVNESNVECITVLKTQKINLTEVTEAQWRIGQNGGRLILKTPSVRLKLDFSAYPLEQARRLIKFFRLHLPDAVQQGWERYWDFSWRLFDVSDPARREEFAAETRALRGRMAIWLVFGAILLVAGAAVVFSLTGDSGALWRPLVIVLFVPFVFLLRVDRGKIASTIGAQAKAPVLTIVAMILLLLTMCLTGLLGNYGYPGGKMLFYSGLILAVILMFIDMVLISARTRGEKGRKKQAAKLAEAEYLHEKETLRH